jgi:hypothetical protein
VRSSTAGGPTATAALTDAGETAVRLNLVAAWRESTVVTEAEQAALALSEEGTRLADAHHGVSDATLAQVREPYSDDEIARPAQDCGNVARGCLARPVADVIICRHFSR